MQRPAIGLLAIACLALFGAYSLNAAANGERRLAIYNIHNKETLDIVYMRNGKRIPEAIEKLNWVMRDWREDKPTKMDPKLFDILWQIHTELGSREPIHLISGYRSPKTNAMLRRTRGGQAKKSRHMLGKAADVHFPDVPVKHLRYAALVRQQGGVGYYPTSALPFVHVDTGRVRHWPRMGRYELALLFPRGKSLHRPRRGGAISKRDVTVARSRYKTLTQQVAAYFDSRGQMATPRPTLVASASRNKYRATLPTSVKRLASARTASSGKGKTGIKVATLGPAALPPPALVTQPSRIARPIPPPQLTASPRIVEHPSTFKQPNPSNKDRRRLTELFSLASLMPAAKSLFETITWTSAQNVGDTPDEGAYKPGRELTIAALIERDQNNLTTHLPHTSAPSPTPATHSDDRTGSAERFEWGTNFVSAPAYDDEHPEELHYRPFPLAPLLTQTSSPHDPALAKLVHPDVAQTLDFIDDSLTALPMKLRPVAQVAATMWSDQFTGPAATTRTKTATGLASRAVRTTAQ